MRLEMGVTEMNAPGRRALSSRVRSIAQKWTFPHETNEIIVITETGSAGDTGYTINASEAQPRYVIQNDRTGRVRLQFLS
jgi:hypothetical protein